MIYIGRLGFSAFRTANEECVGLRFGARSTHTYAHYSILDVSLMFTCLGVKSACVYAMFFFDVALLLHTFPPNYASPTCRQAVRALSRLP